MPAFFFHNGGEAVFIKRIRFNFVECLLRNVAVEAFSFLIILFNFCSDSHCVFFIVGEENFYGSFSRKNSTSSVYTRSNKENEVNDFQNLTAVFCVREKFGYTWTKVRIDLFQSEMKQDAIFSGNGNNICSGGDCY